MRRAGAALLALLALAVSGGARAEPPRSVQVMFSLAQPRYRLEFGEGLVDLEPAAARAIADALGERIRFVRFTTEPPAETRLTFVLDALDRADRGLMKETGFHIELVAPGAPVRRMYWRFRPLERFAVRLGDADSFVREIRQTIETSDHAALVRDLLSAVPIAKRTKLVPDPFGWVLSHRFTEVCMGAATLLKVRSSFPSGAAMMALDIRAHPSGWFPAPEEEFREGVLLTPAEPQLGLDRLKAAPREQVQVVAVYVVDYTLLVPCTGATSPEAVDFREEPGQ